MASSRFIRLCVHKNSLLTSHIPILRPLSKKAYADNLNLPQTLFPLRANAAFRDLEIQESTGFDSLYEWQRQRETQKEFSLHDGPPYANGDLHMGHLLNKVLKDIINRHKVLQGYKVHYKPGWDCHGLPIELKALKGDNYDNNKMPAIQIRETAKAFAEATIEEQMKSFKRWGVMANWNDVYKTTDKDYEANQLQVFYEMYKKGYIYRGYKPVFWSPSSKTALAEAELEYKDYTSRAVYVKFPVNTLPGGVFGIDGKAFLTNLTYALVWTTTPWTIPFNEAVCYHPSLKYCFAENPKTAEVYCVCTDLLPKVEDILNTKLTRFLSNIGQELDGMVCGHPLYRDKISPLLPGIHVTKESGTGLVHTAPAHGIDDYNISRIYELSLDCAVDKDGLYTEDAGSELEGKYVLGDGNNAALELLRDSGNLLHESDYVHRYPHDWRTKKPVILRATKQWFTMTSGLMQQAKANIFSLKMYPEPSRNRFLSMIENHDWCISRQRYWGVPIPVFYHKLTDEPLIDDDSIAHITKLVREYGSNCWWNLPMEKLFPIELAMKHYTSPAKFRRGEDTMDVWFDSGTSWATVMKDQDGVADLYVEGTDQHRGWFHSSLITSTVTQSKAPYKGILTHGFVMDENNRKMSKSLGNIVYPDEAITGTKKKVGLGADVLRLWVAASGYAADLSCSNSILERFGESLRKVRNSARFLLGNLYDFNIASNEVEHNQMLEIDQYVLHRTLKFYEDTISSYDNMQFAPATRHIMNFVNTDLATYFEAIKDRLYAESSNGILRRSAQTSLFHILDVLTRAIGPVTPHLAEEICTFAPSKFYYKPTKIITFYVVRYCSTVCNLAPKYSYFTFM
ncbi:uncharacterized protein TRIADDRAFT_26821 [Trichoplax adhaerens]|uniref:isoleucine--tRNA ligase n=1 Tax=Trichoplax adhaerens TaxID=10228 RepID=B3S0D6_TRIAD|nr:hypothetical protein TRIADDRAFT_26821 [Trichoplax adhaerens]EDV24362.1 hypothetical protein TRIADDRAFT_26821 [Trichoplax adhaerens]|eukprot:XP_002113888.1 hypothetical protein TRIADDRAFT_26821 [Trichoplax adhaerens]